MREPSPAIKSIMKSCGIEHPLTTALNLVILKIAADTLESSVNHVLPEGTVEISDEELNVIDSIREQFNEIITELREFCEQSK